MKKKLFAVLAVTGMAVVLLSACGDNGGDVEDGEETGTGNEEAVGEMEQEEIDVEEFDEEDTFLRINGEDVPFQDFEDQLEQTKHMAATQYGIDFDDEDAAMMIPQLQHQAVEALITENVMLQEAEAQGIEISEEQVEENVEELTEQFEGEEGLAQAMEAEGLDDESLRVYLYENMKIESLLMQNLDLDNIEVTEEEKEAYYAQLQETWEEQGQEEASYEEVEPQITQQLEEQKVQEKQMEYIGELVENSEVERLYQ